MLQHVADESENHGMKTNKSKTKVMMENNTPIYVNNTQIENVVSYIYLEQRDSTIDKNQDKEIQRRITARWTAFAHHRHIFKGNIIYNSCILPAMTYGTHTQAKNKLAAAQTKMERSILNITYRGRKNKHLGKRKDQDHRRD